MRVDLGKQFMVRQERADTKSKARSCVVCFVELIGPREDGTEMD